MKTYLKAIQEQKKARDLVKTESLRMNQNILSWMLSHYYQVNCIEGFDSDYTTFFILYTEDNYKAIQHEFKQAFEGIDFSIYTSSKIIDILDIDGNDGLINNATAKQSVIKLIVRHYIY